MLHHPHHTLGDNIVPAYTNTVTMLKETKKEISKLFVMNIQKMQITLFVM